MNELKIEKAIIHQIDHHHYDQPLLAEEALPITQEINNFFTNLIIQNLEHQYIRNGKFHENPDNTTSFRNLSDGILDDAAHFVSYSQLIARHFFHTVVNNKSITTTNLVICTFSEAQNPIRQLALTKIYPENVFTFSRERTDGELRHNLNRVPGILSTDKWQKCAFVLPRELREIRGYDLRVLDLQVSRYDREVTSYFVKFLQCRLEPTKKVKMKTKFFISYSSKDNSVAEQISNVLQESGFDTWLDKKDIVIGQPILDRVSKGIETESDFVIILISKNSIDSEWCRLELRMAYQKELTLKRTVVLPIRIDDVDVPVEVMTKKYYQLNPHSKTSVDSLVKEIKTLLKLQR